MHCLRHEHRCRSTPNRTETHPASSLPGDWPCQRDDVGACQCRRAPDIVRRLRLGGSQVAGLARAHARASAGPSVASLAILKRAHRPTVRFCARIPALLHCNQCSHLSAWAWPTPAQRSSCCRRDTCGSRSFRAAARLSARLGACCIGEHRCRAYQCAGASTRSLESMYLAFQTSCIPDSFSGIYQN